MDDAPILEADHAFFAALLANDPAGVEAVLTDDFQIVDVGSGGLTSREQLLAAFRTGQLSFQAIEADPERALIRRYGDAAIVIGATRMRLELAGGDPLEVSSRYTHVFVRSGEAWLLASAQGTPIR